MPFNGSGVFIRLYSWVNDAAANIKIRADRMDNETNGIATGLTNCITRDGQSPPTANLPMATFKHTAVGNSSLRNQYFAAGQAVDGLINWAVAGGTADAITASYTIPLSTLADGQLCFVRAGFANATTTPTFSPDGITARTIVKNGGVALAAGDIAGANHEIILRYKLASTRWELLNPAVSIVAASTSVSGIVELATTAEALAGTDTTRAITADGLAYSKGVMLQNSKSADYTLVITDSGKQIYHPSADTTPRTWTIPANASVAFEIGTMVTLTNDTSGGALTIVITSDTLVWAGPGTTGSRTLSANGTATIQKMTSTRWMISGSGLS